MERYIPAEPRLVDCMWWKRGHCPHGGTCHFRHTPWLLGIRQKPAVEVAKKTNIDRDGDSLQDGRLNANETKERCSICYELPKVYGLLVGCDHVFCLDCIRLWRGSKNNDGSSLDVVTGIWGPASVKTCPLCRKASKYIIPSAVFPTPPAATDTSNNNNHKPTAGIVEGGLVKKQGNGTANPLKESIIKGYSRSLKRIPCRNFKKSIEKWNRKKKRAAKHRKSAPSFRPVCYFANKCHYAHTDPTTRKPYIFSKSRIIDIETKRLSQQSQKGEWQSPGADGDIVDSTDEAFMIPHMFTVTLETETGLRGYDLILRGHDV